MKSVKSFKIVLLITAMAMFLCAAVMQIKPLGVHAASQITPSVYFTYSAEGESKFDYVDNLDDDFKVNGADVDEGVVAEVKAGDVITLKNQVVVDDLGIKVIADANVKKFTVVLKAASYDVNGNRIEKDGEVEFDKEISVEYVVALNKTATVEFGVKDGYIVATSQEGGVKNAINDTTNSYYKIRHVDKTPVELSIKIDEVSGDSAASFVITDINQKASAGYVDNKFNQTFNLNDDKSALAVNAIPRAVIADSFFTNVEGDTYLIKKLDGTLYTMSLTAYSVMNITRASSMFLEAGAMDDNGYNIAISTETTSKRIVFNLKPNVDAASQMKFNISVKEADVSIPVESYDVQVLPTSVENEAPKYKDYEQVKNQVDSFQKALDIATTVDGHSIPVGEKINLPSLENFITDDYSSFNKLTKTVHLVTPSKEDKSTTSSSIKFDEIGEYKLYVTFKDENGASMENTDFYSTDLDATPKYKDFVFTIVINDDAPLVVKPHDQDEGYVGVVYKATAFEVVAGGYSTNYKLYYNSDLNATKDSNGWKEILTVKDFTSSGEGEYTIDQLRKIAYDGQLTFKPDQVGSYKIDCHVYSDKSYRDATESTIIRIVDNPVPVKPASTWLRDNVWSVVFLSVGTLCLAGIIVLLCIKPKDSADKE